jgi:hypothetical protein
MRHWFIARYAAAAFVAMFILRLVLGASILWAAVDAVALGVGAAIGAWGVAQSRFGSDH